MHLVQYMSKTEGYHLVYRKTPRGISNLHQSIRNGSFDFSTVAEKQEHLLEVFSDSDWAGNKSSRKSTSSGTMFLDGQVIYGDLGDASTPAPFDLATEALAEGQQKGF